jgi:hypothetical protein
MPKITEELVDLSLIIEQLDEVAIKLFESKQKLKEKTQKTGIQYCSMKHHAEIERLKDGASRMEKAVKQICEELDEENAASKAVASWLYAVDEASSEIEGEYPKLIEALNKSSSAAAQTWLTQIQTFGTFIRDSKKALSEITKPLEGLQQLRKLGDFVNADVKKLAAFSQAMKLLADEKQVLAKGKAKVVETEDGITITPPPAELTVTALRGKVTIHNEDGTTEDRRSLTKNELKELDIKFGWAFGESPIPQAEVESTFIIPPWHRPDLIDNVYNRYDQQHPRPVGYGVGKKREYIHKHMALSPAWDNDHPVDLIYDLIQRDVETRKHYLKKKTGRKICDALRNVGVRGIWELVTLDEGFDCHEDGLPEFVGQLAILPKKPPFEFNLHEKAIGIGKAMEKELFYALREYGIWMHRTLDNEELRVTRFFTQSQQTFTTSQKPLFQSAKYPHPNE